MFPLQRGNIFRHSPGLKCEFQCANTTSNFYGSYVLCAIASRLSHVRRERSPRFSEALSLALGARDKIVSFINCDHMYRYIFKSVVPFYRV